ncbi:trehalose transporter 1-like protein isoform X1 [Leptinotarsa decemlineata]|uniref:trehalose transporter 1-like protein isoform X1 n=2 Tax=Leptinotarsa decemlineata TaxID=7539 RepID=UPI003D307B74
MAMHMNYAYIVVFAGNLLALTGDTTLTWSSPILPKLHSNDSSINPLRSPITDDEESWIGSLQYIGAMCGIIPVGYLADRIGRKPVLLFLALPHLAAYLAFAFAKNINWYYFGRFVGGVSLASSYVVLPMYVAEISEDSYRGMLLVSYSTFASFGDLVPYIMGPYISIFWFNIILAIFPLVFFISFSILAPESPYFYVDKNDYKAELSLKKLRHGQLTFDAKNEIEEIKNEKLKNQEGDFINTLKKKYVIRGFSIALGLSCFQQLSGLGAILAYTEIIFKDAGTDVSADVASLIVGIVLFLASFGGPLMVDRKGRKFLLICSATGMIVSLSVLGSYFYLKDETDVSVKNISWLPILCLVIYTVTFNIGFGPLPYTITSEILPSNIKFFLATVASFVLWLVSFVVTKFFNDLNVALGKGGTFWLFAGFCATALLFIIFIVPETKGKSFQEIQSILNR